MLYGKIFRYAKTRPIWKSSTGFLLWRSSLCTAPVFIPTRENLNSYLFVKVKLLQHPQSFLDCGWAKFGTMSDTDDKKAELKKRLTPLQYHVTQEKGTERAFTGKFNKNSEAGTYSCIVCDQPLFSSQTKFDSGCGWPAFNNVLDQGKVKLTKDTSNVGANLLLLIANPGMIRTEVTCAQCGAHLGHVFGDGPPPTKKRFCINSASLQFHPDEENQEST